jgi:hypothetical protein
MVDVDMNLMPSKVIGREACLQAKGSLGLKDLRPKRHPNILWREKLKEMKDSMKVEDGGVHCKRYDGCCAKQRVRIPMAT